MDNEAFKDDDRHEPLLCVWVSLLFISFIIPLIFSFDEWKSISIAS